MKFTANRLTLYTAAKTASKVVSKSTIVPEISGILFEASTDTGELRLTGTDIRTHIQKRLIEEHIEQTGSAVVPIVVVEILNLLAGEQVSFELWGNMLQINSGNAHYMIQTLDPKGFPSITIPFPEDTIRIKGLNSLIRHTVFAAAVPNDSSYGNPLMQCVKIAFSGGSTKASATDGTRMALAESPHCADGELEMIIHQTALNILCSIVKPDEELYTGIANNCAVLFNADMIYSTMLLNGNFMDIQQVIDHVEPVSHATVDAKQFYAALDAAVTCLQKDDDQCVNLIVDNGEVKISAAAYGSECHTKAEAKNAIASNENGFNYRPKILTDYLRFASGPLKLSFDKRGFLLMDANKNKYVASPRRPVTIRVPEVKKPKEEKAAKPKKTTRKKAEAKKAAA